MAERRVVVTGMGAITPIGNTLEQFWDGLKNGVSGADYITHFDTEKFATKFAAMVSDFDPGKFIEPKAARPARSLLPVRYRQHLIWLSLIHPLTWIPSIKTV